MQREQRVQSAEVGPWETSVAAVEPEPEPGFQGLCSDGLGPRRSMVSWGARDHMQICKAATQDG